MATVAGSKYKLYDINSSELFMASYQNFVESIQSKSLPCPSPPESYKTLSRQSPLKNFPSNFPAVKRIPRTRFVVDGFRSAGAFSVTYFLSHFHTDHYVGLNPHWGRGLIFCSEITARLLVECLKVSAAFVVPLGVGEMVRIDNCEVTLIDANHCPGAVQVLFRVYTEGGEIERYVHTGDMRYSPSMKLEPALCDFIGADAVFLDTTYCNPKFVFPSQTESVEYVANTIHKIINEESDGVDKYARKSSVLFLISAYVVGKEKILLAVSRRCNCLLHVDDRKLSILKCLDLVDTEVFTTDFTASNVHVIGWNVLGETWPYFRPNWGNMERIMHERGYSRVVGFVPTGWLYEVKRDSFPVRMKGSFEVHLVPYSEHSNYDELRDYVEFLRPKGIIPTVGLEGGGLDSKQAASMMKYFTNLVDETAQKRKFLKGFNRKAVAIGPNKNQEDVEEVSNNQDVREEARENSDYDERDMEMERDCQQGLNEVVGRMENDTAEAYELNLTAESTLADAIQKAKNVNVSCSKFESETTLGVVGTAVQMAPRAFFGKGARKKRHDSQLVSLPRVNLDPSSDVCSAPKGPMNPNDMGIREVPSIETSGTFAPFTGEDEHQVIGGAEAVGEMDETLEELKTCLPNWVTANQIKYLFTQSQGDIAAAVSEFYEHETEFREQVVANRCANSPGDEGAVADKYCVSIAAATSGQGSLSPATVENKVFKIGNANTRIPNQNSKSTIKNISRRRSAGSKHSDWSIDNKFKKKSRLSMESISNNCKQPAITNFFRKAGLDATSQPGITSPECAPKVAAGSQSGGLGIAFTFKDSKKLYGERLSKLLQVLDGTVSKEDALTLLDKAKGDVNVALDLYYTACGESLGKEAGRLGSSSGKCNPPLQTDSNPLHYNSGESTCYNIAEPGLLTTQKQSESSMVDTKACSVTLPLEKYNPVEHGELAPYLHLARTFDLVEQESGKLKTTVMLCNMFRSLLALSPEDVLPTVYLCTNRIAPDYENVSKEEFLS
eukprot:Gb_21652 [translate_table: standard]